MRTALRLLLVLLVLNFFFASSFDSLDRTVTAVFESIETATLVSKETMMR